LLRQEDVNGNDADLSEKLAGEDLGVDAGSTIPLAGIDYCDIVLLYPVAQISALMRRAEDSFVERVPTFLDFRNKSIVFKVLTTRLW
jgi:hypothetical protein